jgi:prepilin-type N-terminal cleavage/methylation domain-containing protein
MVHHRISLTPHQRRGFTLLELLVLVLIMAVAASLALVAINRSKRSSQGGTCMSNLTQLHKAFVLFDQYHDVQREDYPLRLTYLRTGSPRTGGKFASEDRLFQCPADKNHGEKGSKPPNAAKRYEELDEGPGMGAVGDPPCSGDAPFCSYLYEFSGAKCSWWKTEMLKGNDGFTAVDTCGGENGMPDGKVSWQEAKFYQLEHGDSYQETGYPRTWFPILRCFWHTQSPDAADGSKDQEILNLAIDGNFFVSGVEWEIIARENNTTK